MRTYQGSGFPCRRGRKVCRWRVMPATGDPENLRTAAWDRVRHEKVCPFPDDRATVQPREERPAAFRSIDDAATFQAARDIDDERDWTRAAARDREAAPGRAAEGAAVSAGLVRRSAARRAPRELYLMVRCVDGPLAGKSLRAKPPLTREFGYMAGGTETRYEVHLDGTDYVAFVRRPDDDTVPVVAWRCWNVDREILQRPLLRSLNDGYVWPTHRPLIAKCDVVANALRENAAPEAGGGGGKTARELPHAEDEVVVFDCTCGIWTTRTHEELTRATGRGGEIYGLVALWGRVQPHEYGYRGQRAYPLALIFNPHIELADGFAPADWQKTVVTFTRSLARTYRVPTLACTPDRATAALTRLIAGGGLPKWTREVLPLDLQLALARAADQERRERKP